MIRQFTGALLVLGAVTGCGDSGVKQVQDLDEVLVRTAVSVQGQAALSGKGAQVSGPLSCTSERSDSGVEVNCAGRTVDGRAVAVTGTATSLSGGNAVKGEFVGALEGQQVFTSQCLGC
jgi:hypothetical protein